MSWAASRETTREEDLAYSLIGLFSCNMPMLYGEGGKRAFLRLQEEIMHSNEDQSIFAWIKSGDDNMEPDAFHGLLADSPKDFRHTGATIAYSELGDLNPTSMTARGLNITLPLTQKQDGTSIAALQCPVPGQGYGGWLAVYLQRLNTGSNQYARKDCGKLASVNEVGTPQPLYVRQHFSTMAGRKVYPYHFFQVSAKKCTVHSDSARSPLCSASIRILLCSEVQSNFIPLSLAAMSFHDASMGMTVVTKR